jgi:hypothetical protein
MKLLELLPSLEMYKRIKRKSWDLIITGSVIRSEYKDFPLMKLDIFNLQVERYCPSYSDLIADDWEIVE